MANAKKNKHGTWTILVYSHTITQKNGKEKRIYQRFTAKNKKDCERMAKEFEVNKKPEKIQTDMTIYEAIKSYIEIKSNVLSPSTLRSYNLMLETKFPLIKDIKLTKLTNENIQREINTEAATLSPKYIRNIYGLLTATLQMFAPSFKTHFSYPDYRRKEISIPTTAEINQLLSIPNEPFEQLLAVKLAAFLGLRRGEICGIHVSDIILPTRQIYIRRSVVLSPDKQWIEKEPKTKAGRRELLIPEILIDDISKALEGKNPEDKLISLTPSQISDRFKTMIKQAKISKCTFHSLRHYFASIMLANNIPNKYAKELMGHETSYMLENVYQHTMNAKKRAISNQINDFFSSEFPI